MLKRRVLLVLEVNMVHTSNLKSIERKKWKDEEEDEKFKPYKPQDRMGGEHSPCHISIDQ